MRLLTQSKYLIRKPKIVPVKIDFPLPNKVQGEEHRLNKPNTFKLPEHLIKKHQPTNLIGENIRLSHLLESWEQYVDKVVTVAGWAR